VGGASPTIASEHLVMRPTIRSAVLEDEPGAVELWRACDLVTGYNDPAADFRFAKADAWITENTDQGLDAAARGGDGDVQPPPLLRTRLQPLSTPRLHWVSSSHVRFRGARQLGWMTSMGALLGGGGWPKAACLLSGVRFGKAAIRRRAAFCGSRPHVSLRPALSLPSVKLALQQAGALRARPPVPACFPSSRSAPPRGARHRS
jgi:hypothetical protein